MLRSLLSLMSRRLYSALVLPHLLGGVGCSLVVPTELLTEGDQHLECMASQKICPIDESEPDGPRECVDNSNPVTGCGTDSCRPCEVPGALARCTTEGKCGIAICEPDFADCDGDESNGCEVDTSSDDNNCGGCGTQCAQEDGAASCINGSCEVYYCTSTFQDCDNDRTTGCETDTLTDAKHCGACDSPCETDCSQGKCTP